MTATGVPPATYPVGEGYPFLARGTPLPDGLTTGIWTGPFTALGITSPVNRQTPVKTLTSSCKSSVGGNNDNMNE